MQLKLKKITIFLTMLSLIFIGCGRKNQIVENIDEETSIIKNDVNGLVEKLKQRHTSFDDNVRYKVYKIYDNFSEDKVYNLSGKIVENSEHKFYISIQSNDFCYFKDFDDNEIKSYNITDSIKCHKTYVDGDNAILAISAFDLNDEELYYDSILISNNSIKLFVSDNLIDSVGCKYQWYRNGEKILDSNVDTYYVISDFEDADYYVEMTTYEGEVIKSDIINVKIDKNL